MREAAADPVEVIVEDPRWEAAGLPDLASRAAGAALRHVGLEPGAFEIAVLACDDARIAGLNEAFRGRPAPTNVLAWPSEERDPATRPRDAALGDVALSFDTCEAEARQQGKALGDHATHLVVHATLHLLGYDHAEDESGRLMERLERDILAGMGLPDPYVPRDEATIRDPVRRQKGAVLDEAPDASP